MLPLYLYLFRPLSSPPPSLVRTLSFIYQDSHLRFLQHVCSTHRTMSITNSPEACHALQADCEMPFTISLARFYLAQSYGSSSGLLGFSRALASILGGH